MIDVDLVINLELINIDVQSKQSSIVKSKLP
ncbi:hypothetical protein C8D85_0143 [Marinomonas communis]|uniref:Uncharacterized protein n=1 Tax=Marinomonas communis TaxID=28254 RepID=A0A4R6XC91_9GAMM|nr:hypothetical protein C8D85_0143 [Marinomonas communis]